VPELFFVYLKVATWGGLFVALPYLFFELWGFMAPGLYPHERKRLWPALVAIPALFYVGGAFAFWVIVPGALSFFLSFSQPGVVGLPALGEYLKLMFNLCFAVGLAFNLPVVLVLLVQVGVLSVEKLRKGRRLAIVLILVFAAIVTPPDPFSQVIFALPLLALYELAIVTAAWLKKQPKSLAKTG
jgi:sec-independent protein translocase protein TatC